MVVGVGFIGTAAAGYAYGAWQEFEVERIVAARDLADRATATAGAAELATVPVSTITVAPTATNAANSATAIPSPATAATSQAVTSDTVTPVAQATSVPVTRSAPSATPISLPIVMPTPAPLRRVMSPRIALDAPILDAPLVRGEWQVPKFAAGHLKGTALPGQGSNIVLSGHLQSLSSGNVFGRLNELEPGDEVTVRTTRSDVRYIVEGKMFVPPTDLSVVQPTNREELTLLTCWGTWDPIRQDYSLRLIVWGVRA